MAPPRIAERLQQTISTPVGDGSHWLGAGLREPVPLGAGSRISQASELLLHRKGHQRIPTVEDVEDEAADEVDSHPERVGQRERQHPAALLGGDVESGQLVLHVVPVVGEHLQQVPVQRAIRCRAHRAHQLERVVAELTNGWDELQGGAGELTDHAAQ